MASTSYSPRAENRTAMKVFVELYSFDNATYEITNTVDVSPHGARVLSKNPWAPNQRLSVREVRGHLYSRARIVYCQPRADQCFAIGLELQQPSDDWPASTSLPCCPVLSESRGLANRRRTSIEGYGPKYSGPCNFCNGK